MNLDAHQKLGQCGRLYRSNSRTEKVDVNIHFQKNGPEYSFSSQLSLTAGGMLVNLWSRQPVLERACHIVLRVVGL